MKSMRNFEKAGHGNSWRQRLTLRLAVFAILFPLLLPPAGDAARMAGQEKPVTTAPSPATQSSPATASPQVVQPPPAAAAPPIVQPPPPAAPPEMPFPPAAGGKDDSACGNSAGTFSRSCRVGGAHEG